MPHDIELLTVIAQFLEDHGMTVHDVDHIAGWITVEMGYTPINVAIAIDEPKLRAYGHAGIVMDFDLHDPNSLTQLLDFIHRQPADFDTEC